MYVKISVLEHTALFLSRTKGIQSDLVCGFPFALMKQQVQDSEKQFNRKRNKSGCKKFSNKNPIE